MAILDWIKEVPISAIYKERLADSVKQVSLLETENVSLKKEVSELKARLSQLEEDRRTLDKEIMEIKHIQSLTFVQKYGIWLDKSKNLHYCPVCKSNDKFSPLQTSDNGFYCTVCDKGFYERIDQSRPFIPDYID